MCHGNRFGFHIFLSLVCAVVRFISISKGYRRCTVCFIHTHKHRHSPTTWTTTAKIRVSLISRVVVRCYRHRDRYQSHILPYLDRSHAYGRAKHIIYLSTVFNLSKLASLSQFFLLFAPRWFVAICALCSAAKALPLIIMHFCLCFPDICKSFNYTTWIRLQVVIVDNWFKNERFGDTVTMSPR